LKDISAKTTLINKSLKRISRDLGFEDVKLTTHIARHTYSQLAMVSGYSIEEVSELLNHANPRTTKAYSGGNRNNCLDGLHKAITGSIQLNLRAV
jgi:integrase